MIFTEITKDEFREFASKSPYRSFMQTPEIAELRKKDGWTPHFLAAKENDEIKAATLLIEKPTFLGKSTFLAPGGPLLDLENKPLANFFLKNLKDYAKSHNGYTLQISPYYELIERTRSGEKAEGGFDRKNALKTLEALKFKPTEETTQPKYLFVMDLNGRTEEELLADQKRNTRNHVRKAEKMGVKIRELKREELKILKDITESTSKRRGFIDRPLSYYEQMYDLFAPRGEVKFFVAEAEVIARPEVETTEAISKHCAGSGSQNYNVSGSSTELLIPAQSRRTRCDFDDREPSTLRNGSVASIPLSAAMFMLTGDEIVYLFSGSDEKYMKDYNAQYLIQWHIIKHAAANGYKRYNFYGIHGLPTEDDNDGIYDFKKGFDSKYGHVVELIGTFETPLNTPVYNLHKFLRKLKHL